MAPGLRIVLFDRSCVGRFGLGLSRVWRSGTHLYTGLGRTDAAHGAATFEEGLDWLSEQSPDRPIQEVQFWGHGKWGRILIGPEALDRSALEPRHRHHGALVRLRERLTDDALFWFRTCETFGAQAGQDFARAWTDFFGCRAAGHTFVIGYWQSGLHLLRPGTAPHWGPDEGLAWGTTDRPQRAAQSSPLAPNTITCLTGRVPDGW